MTAQNDETSGPRFHVFISEKPGDSCRKGQPVGFWQAHGKQAHVCAGRKFSNIRQIVGKCVAALNARLAVRQITVTLSPEVVKLLTSEGFSLEFGARESERAFERLVSKPLAEAILNGGITSGNAVVAELEHGKVIFIRMRCV